MQKKLIDSKFFNILLMVLVAFAFLLLYSFSTSPLYVNEGMDSCVFKTIGLGILNGKVPYVDIFDHKGPLLFYINALGLLISRSYGILLLQVVNMTVTMWFLYLIASLFVNKRASMVMVIVALVFYSGLISEGNQCEEWMLASVTVSLYMALKIVRDDMPLTVVKSFLFGLFFGIVFFIRTNDAVSTVGGVFFGLCIYQIVQKKFRPLLMGCMAFLVGFLVVASPIVILYCAKGAYNDLMYGLFGFNMRYTGGLANMITGVFREKYVLLILCIASCAVIFATGYRKLLFLFLPMLLLSCVMTGNHRLMHYYIVLLPLFFGIVGVCASNNRTLAFVMMCLLMLPTYSVIRVRNRNTVKSLFVDGNRIVEEYYNKTAVLFDGIPKEERNSVWNYNLDYQLCRSFDVSPFSLLYHNGIVQCNKAVLWWHCFEDPDNWKSESIVNTLPLWIILNRSSQYLPDLEFIEQHYELFDESESICMYRLNK